MTSSIKKHITRNTPPNSNVKLKRMIRKVVKFNVQRLANNIKGATSQFVLLEKFSLNFSSLSSAICVNLLHP